ncbi:MAG: hypothetical protein MRJ65_15595 [Candidatus Brocadiaceae bacterium]|nr:hypothetical protein [Candidatus Brocadiaceae bacterium]
MSKMAPRIITTKKLVPTVAPGFMEKFLNSFLKRNVRNILIPEYGFIAVEVAETLKERIPE